jgi:phage gp36-like protein
MAAAYTTISACIARLGDRLYQILGVNAGADVSANAHLLAAINDANEKVESYVLPQYPDGLDEPSKLVGPATALAVVALIEGKRRDLLEDADVAFADRAVSYLRDVASGKARIQADGEAELQYETLPEQSEIGSGTNVSAAGDYVGSRHTWFNGL